MKLIWKHDRTFGIPTHVYRDKSEKLFGFVRKSTAAGDGYASHWFARAYVSHTHDNGFFVKTLAEGKAIVEDMLAKEAAR
jgi:hypothetical protein